MRHIQGVIPGVALDEAHIDSSKRVKLGFAPGTVDFFGVHKAAGFIKYILPVLRIFYKAVVNIRPSKLLSHLGDAPVVIGIFQSG